VRDQGVTINAVGDRAPALAKRCSDLSGPRTIVEYQVLGAMDQDRTLRVKVMRDGQAAGQISHSL
jgi:hypothetical protein